jgi:hypothetical protein
MGGVYREKFDLKKEPFRREGDRMSEWLLSAA